MQSGVHTTGQTNMKGMHWSKFRVTVECEEDRYNTNLNGVTNHSSDPLSNHMTILCRDFGAGFFSKYTRKT